jgi:hypothetical protein
VQPQCLLTAFSKSMAAVVRVAPAALLTIRRRAPGDLTCAGTIRLAFLAALKVWFRFRKGRSFRFVSAHPDYRHGRAWSPGFLLLIDLIAAGKARRGTQWFPREVGLANPYSVAGAPSAGHS